MIRWIKSKKKFRKSKYEDGAMSTIPLFYYNFNNNGVSLYYGTHEDIAKEAYEYIVNTAAENGRILVTDLHKLMSTETFAELVYGLQLLHRVARMSKIDDLYWNSAAFVLDTSESGYSIHIVEPPMRLCNYADDVVLGYGLDDVQ